MRHGRVEVVLVAHNEEGTIASTIREFLAAAEVEVLVAEDGSSDRTRAVVAEIAAQTPGWVRLTPPSARKGYSRAVADAVAKTRQEVVVFCDGDGQYEPRDLPKLIEALERGVVVAGARSPRRDSRSRMLASRAFGLVYRLLVPLRMNDPSSPFVAAFRSDLIGFVPAAPFLAQGFWWEFFARADAAGLQIAEIPIGHRVRPVGTTQVYRLRCLPRIVAAHVVGLVKLRRELRRARLAHDIPSAIVQASVVKPR